MSKGKRGKQGGSKFIVQNRSSRYSGICAVPDFKTQSERGTCIFDKSYRTAAGSVLDPALYLRFVSDDSGFVCIVEEGIRAEVVKIVMIGMTAMLLGILLKGSRPEYALYLSLAAGICMFAYMTEKLVSLFFGVMQIREYLPLDIKYISTLLKMLGATYISQFSSEICKDAGYGAVAGQIEIFTKLYIMVLSMPVLLALMEAIHGFLS